MDVSTPDPVAEANPFMATPHTPPNPDDVPDVVPGDPPVPITVWRINTTPPDNGLSPALATRILLAYTRSRQLVADTHADPAIAAAARALGRQYRLIHPAVAPRNADEADVPGNAGVVITRWPPRADAAGIAPAELLAGYRQRLTSGGLLIVVVTVPAPDSGDVFADHAGPLVATCQRVGFGYLQHIVAAHVTTTGTGLAPTLAGRQQGAHLRIHTDLYILTRQEVTRRA